MPSKASTGLTIRKMTERDISAVEELYKYAAITAENHRIRLSHGENSFERRGGMFIVQDRASLEKFADKPEEKLIIADNRGDICGSLWYGRWFEGLFDDLKVFDGFEEYDGFIARKGREGRLAYAKEIIVRRPAPMASAALMLFMHMMDDYLISGFEYVTGRLYRVDFYEDERGRRACRMINTPSYRLLTRTGGLHIGQTGPVRITVDTYTATVTPQVFVWKTSESSEILHSILRDELLAQA